MAAVARPQVAGGNSSLKAALIAFVCITVASLGGLVYLFTLQSTYQDETKTAASTANQARDEANQARQRLTELAKQTIGEATDEQAKIDQGVAAVRGALLKDETLKGKILPDMPLAGALQTLYTHYQTTAGQLAEMTKEREKVNAELAALNKAAQENQKTFTDRIAQLQQQYEKLEKEAVAARDAWTKDVADLNKKLAAATDTAGQHLSKEREAVQTLTKELAQRDTRIKELRDTLASFRPSADLTAPIQIADGRIVRTIPGQNLVYISLGTRDGVKPGMNFAVYSANRGIPSDGKGKANLEVIHVFDNTAECKVLSTTATDPIVDGDIIANPVFDKNRQFNFVVAGDFDLNSDGKIEDTAGQQVARMIQAWGGKVVKTVDTRTDFVVLGEPPYSPILGPASDKSTADERMAELAAARQAFDKVAAEAKALNIPILNRTQFLQFIGRPTGRNGGSST